MRDLLVVAFITGAFILGRLVQFVSDARSAMGKGARKRAERR